MENNTRRASDIQLPRPALLRGRVFPLGQRSMTPSIIEEGATLLDHRPSRRPFDDIMLMDSLEHHPTPQSTEDLTSNDHEHACIPSVVAISRGVHALSHWLDYVMRMAMNVVALPACHYFFSSFRYVQDDTSIASDVDGLTVSNSVLDVGVSHQFKTKIGEMVQTWDLIKIISLFFIGAAPVVLQIQPIYTSNVTRVSVVSSGLLACASLVCSYIYVLNKHSFTARRIMDVKWKAASTSGPASDFWSLVALPLTFVLWSILFFLVTLFYFIWGLAFTVVDTDGVESTEAPYMDMLLSALFVTGIPVISFLKIYRARKEIKGVDPN